MIDYSKEYSGEILLTFDGSKHLEQCHIKYGDALASICYALDIPYDLILETYPEVKKNEMWVGGSLESQLKFLNKYKRRKPEHILEIGAGRGEVSLVLSSLGYKVTSLDPGKDFLSLIDYSNSKLFPDTEVEIYRVIQDSLHTANLNYSEYDTIIMVESLEHILQEHFDPEWKLIEQTFKGYFIVVNWKKYHPIAVGQYAPPNIHCRLVNDSLYDLMSKNKEVLVRDGSHLCLNLI